MNLRKFYTSLFLFVVFVIVFFVKDRFTGELYQDEFHYLPTAVFFSQEPVPSIHLLKSYNELNTPVPFILGGWVVNIFGESIRYLRLLTCVVSFGLLMLFVWFSPDRSKRFFLCLAGLLAFPNYYLCSVYYYTDIFAMILVLAGFIAYVRRAHLPGLLFFVLAISSRQYMLAFPAAIAVYELWQIWKKSFGFKEFAGKIFSDKTWIYYSLAVVSILPWVLLWHGPAPAAVMAQQHYDSDKIVTYNFGFVLYSSVCLAVYYVIPEVLFTGKIKYFIDYPRNHTLSFIAFIVCIAAIISFYPARQAYNPYFTWPYLGYIDQFFMTIGIAGLIKQICFGILMLITLMRFVTLNLNLASCIVIINVLLLGKAQLSWDKYSLPMIMALWFLAMFDQEWSLSRFNRDYKSLSDH